MNISGAYIPSELVTRATRTQQPGGTAPSTHKVRQAPAPTSTEQQKTVSESIIDAEFVDLYQPIRPPPGHSQHWRTLLVEPDEEKVSDAPSQPESDSRLQKLITRYGEHTNDTPLPGSHLNLIV